MIILMQVAKKVLMEGYRSITSDDFVNLQSNFQCYSVCIKIVFKHEKYSTYNCSSWLSKMSITFGWDIEAAFSDLIFGFKRSTEMVSMFWEIESFSIFKDSLQRSVLHFVSLLRLECFGAVEMLLELPSSTFFIPEPGRCRPKKGVNVFDFNNFFVVIAFC